MGRMPLKSGEIYHIFNKSIAGYKIFGNKGDYQRFTFALYHYNNTERKTKLANVLKYKSNHRNISLLIPQERQIVKFITYHTMPTHFHMQIKILEEKYMHQYLNNIQNSYTRYFNTKYNRKGPLWQSAYKAVRVTSNEQTLHLSRYIHLNSTTAGLVEKPEDWEFSSYREYINNEKILKEIMTEISINNPVAYKKFVENHKDYQQKLKVIEKLIKG